jgi:AcrR family transcriptional regulator
MERNAPSRFAAKGSRTSGKPAVARGRPSREQSALRNEELLERTLELFLAKGFEATTVEAITEPIGMSTRTVYARYGDKSTLFKAAIQRAIDEWIVPVEQLAALEGDDFGETLLNIALMLARKLCSPAGIQLWRISSSEVFRLPEIGSYLWERTAHPTIVYLAELFRCRLPHRNLTQPEAEEAALAFLILTVESAVHLVAFFDLADDEFDRQIAFRTRLFLKGARAL